jgi:hypothetical protein
MNFNELTTTRLGTMAEELLITEFSVSKDSKPFTPAFSASFPVDSLCIKGSRVYGLEIKAKQYMDKYPFTGFDKKDFDVYNELDVPVYVLFADYKMKKIYGQWTSNLQHQPSKEFGQVIVWPLTGFTFYRDMKDHEVQGFINLSKL